MDEYHVVGFRRVDFTDSKTNAVIAGYTLFLQRESVDDSVVGYECVKQFVSDRVGYVPSLGDDIALLYNRYGKIGAVKVI